MKKARSAGPRALAVTLVVVLSSLAGGQLFSSASNTTAHPAAAPSPEILISPGVVQAAGATRGPSTTAECEKAYHIACYEPFQIQKAYDLAPLFKKGIDGKGQTIVIVDSFGSPTIRHDLAVFDKQFGLPAPPSFDIIRPAGPVAPYKPTPTRSGWAGETTLDVEYSHVMAPGASIVLVETPDSENEGKTGFPSIVKAEKYVIDHHLGGVISQSFSATEQSFSSAQQLLSLRSAYKDAAQHGVTVLAASGDSGAADVRYNGETYYTYPVTCVGGTELHLNAGGTRTKPDSVWNDTYNKATNEYAYGDAGPNPLSGGGGRSVIFARPGYQNSVKSVVDDQRGVPDISMSASCNGSVDTYMSFGGAPPGWYPVCGTSEATPLFAGVVALADQVAKHPIGLINPALYALSASRATGIVDVTTGNNTVSFTQNNKYYKVTGFPARSGYDLASGVGTIDAAKFVPELAKAAG
jgi:subtilase family serine protease